MWIGSSLLIFFIGLEAYAKFHQKKTLYAKNTTTRASCGFLRGDCDLTLIITISDTSQNHPKKLHSDNQISLSTLIDTHGFLATQCYLSSSTLPPSMILFKVFCKVVLIEIWGCEMIPVHNDPETLFDRQSNTTCQPPYLSFCTTSSKPIKSGLVTGFSFLMYSQTLTDHRIIGETPHNFLRNFFLKRFQKVLRVRY